MCAVSTVSSTCYIIQKRRHGAERFRHDHQQDYNARDERDGDAVKMVRRHNKAIPRLYDELKKRKSITTVSSYRFVNI